MVTMTQQQATQFSHRSPVNATIVVRTLKCGCKPYEDVFTYNRWRAQGWQVQRGQKAIKLPIIIEKEGDDGELKKRFWTAAVFCRHQVQSINSPEPTIAPEPPAITTPAPPEPPAAIIQPSAPATPESNIDNLMKGWSIVA